MNKELRAWLILIALILVGLSPVMYAASQREQEVEPTEVTVETLDVYSTEVQPEKFYDVPLSEELQLHIFEECEKYNIAPALIIAMIERESDFDASAIGDNGNSLGLMQIQPRWHQETMDELGCDDLLDPYQNITVGVAIVSELKDKNPDLYWVLMAYNGGEAYATRKINAEDYSDYAVEITERASDLEDAKER